MEERCGHGHPVGSRWGWPRGSLLGVPVGQVPGAAVVDGLVDAGHVVTVMGGGEQGTGGGQYRLWFTHERARSVEDLSLAAPNPTAGIGAPQARLGVPAQRDERRTIKTCPVAAAVGGLDEPLGPGAR